MQVPVVLTNNSTGKISFLNIPTESSTNHLIVCDLLVNWRKNTEKKVRRKNSKNLVNYLVW